MLFNFNLFLGMYIHTKNSKKKEQSNFTIDNGLVQCKVCLNSISNISENPEWRYYGMNDTKNSDTTRCGMPVNSLLPESSVGSSVAYNSNNKTMNNFIINGQILKCGAFFYFFYC